MHASSEDDGRPAGCHCVGQKRRWKEPKRQWERRRRQSSGKWQRRRQGGKGRPIVDLPTMWCTRPYHDTMPPPPERNSVRALWQARTSRDYVQEQAKGGGRRRTCRRPRSPHLRLLRIPRAYPERLPIPRRNLRKLWSQWAFRLHVPPSGSSSGGTPASTGGEAEAPTKRQSWMDCPLPQMRPRCVRPGLHHRKLPSVQNRPHHFQRHQETTASDVISWDAD